MIHFVILINRQGKVRLTKWYSPYTQKERIKYLFLKLANYRSITVDRFNTVTTSVAKVVCNLRPGNAQNSQVIRELSSAILPRGPKLCNFVEWRGYKVVYKRYASLYLCMCINQNDNELEILELMHHYVEILDRYFGSVCELDLIFNFHKAYYILDELLLAGELQESSKRTVTRLIASQDAAVEQAKEEASSISNIINQATK